MIRRLAMICARGGSTRVPRKNVLPIAGKPLLAYTIEAARDCGLFDQVIVNSEDEEILAIGGLFGAQLYKRPIHLATGTTFMIQVIQEMIASLQLADQDEIAILFPTCPLRTAEDIQGAYRLFADNDSQTPVVAVTEYDYPIQVALGIAADHRLEPVFNMEYGKSTRHNDHAPAYRANYSILFNTAGVLRNQNNLIGERPLAYIMPPEHSLDIDTPFQMEMARLLIEHGKRK